MKLFLSFCFLSFSINAYSATNKWVDSEGKVYYSDESPPSNVKSQELKISAPASGVPAQKSVSERALELKKKLKEKQDSEVKAAQQQESQLAKQKNCEAAKSNLRTLDSTLPVQTINENGERTLMDAAARQQGIEEARKQIDLNCN